MSNGALITSRDPEGLCALGRFEAAYNNANLDPKRAQRLNEHGGELQDEIAKIIRDLATPNRFANEEVASGCTYPPKYTGPKPIEKQIRAIAKIFNLDPSDALEYAKNLPERPEGAEGWFAIPSSEALARKHFADLTDPAEQYCAGLGLMYAKIATSRLFYNHCEGKITAVRLRLVIRTAEALAKIAETQNGDILIIAAQLGFHHRGESVRLARDKFVANEFGLGSLALGSITLTHPRRFVSMEKLNMNCPGDEFRSVSDGDFDKAPFFAFYDGWFRFGTDRVGYACEDYGSASGFLPQ